MKTVINNAAELSALYDSWSADLPKFPLSIEVKELTEKSARTIPQNNALHLYFKWVAETLSASGLDIMQTLRHDVEIQWTDELVKKLMWAIIQKPVLGYTSTARMERADVAKVYDVMNWFLIDRHSIHVDFPDSERLRLNQVYGSKK